jgi:hypothetical protein
VSSDERLVDFYDCTLKSCHDSPKNIWICILCSILNTDVTKRILNSFGSEITEFLVILTQAARAKDEEPYTIDVSPGKCLIPQTVPFDKWKASDWKSFRESLVKIQTSILRRDATASIDDIFSKEGENREIDPSRSVSSMFHTSTPYHTILLFKIICAHHSYPFFQFFSIDFYRTTLGLRTNYSKFSIYLLFMKNSPHFAKRLRLRIQLRVTKMKL